MHQRPMEVVILKPTPVFLSFVASQLPDFELPNYSTLQRDFTAYSIRKQDSDEATLEEIERHFPTMFKYEISRWLGEALSNKVEASFLDFLCCFKFEIHSQIVLMDASIRPGQQLLRIKPRSVLLKWIKSSVAGKEGMQILDKVKLPHLAEDSTVLVKQFKDKTEVTPFIENYYKPLYKAEMLRLWAEEAKWPPIDSLSTFNRYFAIDYHSQLIHL